VSRGLPLFAADDFLRRDTQGRRALAAVVFTIAAFAGYWGALAGSVSSRVVIINRPRSQDQGSLGRLTDSVMDFQIARSLSVEGPLVRRDTVADSLCTIGLQRRWLASM